MSDNREYHKDTALTYAMKMYLRIGRCGTCVDCPTSNGEIYPEFCNNTERADHQLGFEYVISTYTWLKENYTKLYGYKIR